jgi:hypothetical protein
MTNKPCIECGKECEILPVMLGDTFTLTYLRVCSPDCMFIIAYDYLYKIGYHKDFRNSLYDMQNEEDKKQRDEFIKLTTTEFLADFGKRLAENPDLLSTPAPECITNMFDQAPQIPFVSGDTMRFTRPSKDERLRWAKEHLERMKEKLKEAHDDLEKLENGS